MHWQRFKCFAFQRVWQVKVGRCPGSCPKNTGSHWWAQRRREVPKINKTTGGHGNKFQKRLVHGASGWLRVRDMSQNGGFLVANGGLRLNFPLSAGPLRIRCLRVFGRGEKNKASHACQAVMSAEHAVITVSIADLLPRSRSDMSQRNPKPPVSTYCQSIVLLDN